jgi:amino-acid N-acetyltransferase
VSQNTQDYVKWFRQSSPYINAFRGKTFVVMLPGDAIAHSNFPNIVHDLALLNSLGVRLVVVHGARPQIEARLNEQAISSKFHRGLRISESAHMPLIAQAVGEARIHIEAALSTGLPNSPMHGAHLRVSSGNYVIAKPQGVIEGVDYQHTGLVRRIDTNGLKTSIANGDIALVSPIGYSPTGEVFNVSYADVATQVAISLQAEKLISFIEPEGVINKTKGLIRQLTLETCSEHIQQMADKPAHGTRLSLSACLKACQQGIPRGQIISYAEDGALLQELFTRDGNGTLVYADNYEQTRSANIDDVGGILELLAPLEDQGVLVRRSREVLETEIDRFHVMEKDNTVIACAGLYPYGESVAELACVATHPDYRKGGRAAKLLQQLEVTARTRGFTELFVLTTQTAHWFVEQGFREGSLDSLPNQRRDLYNFQRKSKVFFKTL